MTTWCIRAMVSSVLFTAAVAAAQEPEAAVVEEEPAASRFSAGIGLDWTTQYFFRGIPQATSGAIMQPAVEVGASLHEGDGAVSGVSLGTGLWASLHSAGHPDNFDGPKAWYEADYWASVTVGFAGMLDTSLVYTAYTSPNGTFGTVHELALGLALDDSGCFEDATGGIFGGLSPALVVAFEIDGQADGGMDEGIYIEPSLTPSVTLLDADAVSLGLSVPLVLGLSGRSYYEGDAGDEAFGFFRAGLTVALGLAFIPPEAGAWELTVGGDALVLGDSTRVDHRVEPIFRAGLSAAF
jgi:hypothetical protein